MPITHAQFPSDTLDRKKWPNTMSPVHAVVVLHVVTCLIASGTRFTTVLSDGEDVEDSREDASENSSRTSAEPESILSRLKPADCSGLCHKRSVAVNLSRKIILLRSIMAYFWSIMAYLWSIMAYLWSIIGINREHQSIA